MSHLVSSWFCIILVSSVWAISARSVFCKIQVHISQTNLKCHRLAMIRGQKMPVISFDYRFTMIAADMRDSLLWQKGSTSKVSEEILQFEPHNSIFATEFDPVVPSTKEESISYSACPTTYDHLVKVREDKFEMKLAKMKENDIALTKTWFHLFTGGYYDPPTQKYQFTMLPCNMVLEPIVSLEVENFISVIKKQPMLVSKFFVNFASLKQKESGATNSLRNELFTHKFDIDGTEDAPQLRRLVM